jgi:metal-dependent amidase/aminoacylase/carboxypeptidase family protein
MADKDVEACMMIHPVGGMGAKTGQAAITPTLAINTVNVEFFGRTAHAGGAPWDGVNALDAANIAYTSISALRQQIHTTDRVHGIILKGGDAPNSEWGAGIGSRLARSAIAKLTPVIPDHTAMKFYVRAQSAAGVEDLIKRVCACFDGAAQATGCKVRYTTERVMTDLRNNLPISEEYAAAMGEEFHLPTYVAIDDWTMAGGSTDFGNVSPLGRLG